MIFNKKYSDIAKLAILNPHLVYKRIEYNSKRLVSDYASKFGYYNYPYNIIFLAGMAGSASTWMKNLLSKIPGYYTRATPMPFDVAYNHDICDSAFGKIPKNTYTLIKTHLNSTRENLECLKRNNVNKVLVTHRDLRDIVLFRYHRLIEFPKSKDAHDYVDYNQMSKEEALNHSIDHVNNYYVPWIRGWIDFSKQNPDFYHFTKFEDLRKDTITEFSKVLDFFKINLSYELIKKIVESSKGKGNVQQNKKNAKLLPGGLSSNFRSGLVGNWRKEFSKNQIEKTEKLFKSIHTELGYEID